MLLMSLLFASCSKELKYSKEEIYRLAVSADPTTTFLLPDKMNEGITCDQYTEGCLGAHMVQVQKLDFIAVEFMTEEQARFAAKKYRGFYARNWFFDDVSGEPKLERFMSESLKAQRP